MPAGNVSVEAVFEQNTVTVTLDADTGVFTAAEDDTPAVTTKTISVTEGGKITSTQLEDIPTPTKSGYTFKGWYLSTDDTKAVVDLTNETINADVTYKADYVQNFADIAPSGHDTDSLVKVLSDDTQTGDRVDGRLVTTLTDTPVEANLSDGLKITQPTTLYFTYDFKLEKGDTIHVKFNPDNGVQSWLKADSETGAVTHHYMNGGSGTQGPVDGETAKWDDVSGVVAGNWYRAVIGSTRDTAGHLSAHTFKIYAIQADNTVAETETATVPLGVRNASQVTNKITIGAAAGAPLIDSSYLYIPAYESATVNVKGGETPANVEGATVKVKSGTTTIATGDTDTDGNFAIEKIQAGTYTVEVTADGYKSITDGELTVAAGETNTADITLETAGTTATLKAIYTTTDDAEGRIAGLDTEIYGVAAEKFADDTVSADDLKNYRSTRLLSDGEGKYTAYTYVSGGDQPITLVAGENTVLIKVAEDTSHKYYFYKDYSDNDTSGWSAAQNDRLATSIDNGTLKLTGSGNGTTATGTSLVGVTAEAYTLEFDLRLYGANGASASAAQSTTFTFNDGKNSTALGLTATVKSKASANPTRWAVSNATAGNVALTLTAGSWYHYKVVKTTNGATLSVTDSNGNPVKQYTYTVVDGSSFEDYTFTEGENATDIPITISNAGLGQIKFVYGKSWPSAYLDNIKVY